MVIQQSFMIYYRSATGLREIERKGMGEGEREGRKEEVEEGKRDWKNNCTNNLPNKRLVVQSKSIR